MCICDTIQSCTFKVWVMLRNITCSCSELLFLISSKYAITFEPIFQLKMQMFPTWPTFDILYTCWNAIYKNSENVYYWLVNMKPLAAEKYIQRYIRLVWIDRWIQLKIPYSNVWYVRYWN